LRCFVQNSYDASVSIDERLEAREREVTELRDHAKNRELPKLQSALRDLEEAAIVTAKVQQRQAELVKDHSEWLHAHDKAMAEIRENGRALDARIDKLVSAIGKLINKN
jgi:uncharacterized membrane protein YqiK